MRIYKHLKLIGTLAVFACMTGCILPLPHRRVVLPACDGYVSDVITGTPISNATVEVVYDSGTNIIAHTDSSGHWVIPGETSWHAVAIALPPTGISLLPHFRGVHVPCKITIEADGYDKWERPYWGDVDMLSESIGRPTEIPPVTARRKAQLKPKAT